MALIKKKKLVAGILLIPIAAGISVFICFRVILSLCEKEPTRVGSSKCAGCHQREYEEWLASRHSRLIEPATPESVIGDFSENNITRTDDGRIIMSRKNGKYYVTVKGIDKYLAKLGYYDKSEYTFKIDYTIGGRWHQAYLTDFDGQHAYTGIPAFWDRKEKRWIIYQWRSFEGCSCHVTGLKVSDGLDGQIGASTYERSGQPNANTDLQIADKAWAEGAVSCERCHGLGSAHIAIMSGALKHVVSALAKVTSSKTRQRLVQQLNPSDFSGEQQTALCGSCHADSGSAAYSYTLGDDLSGYLDAAPIAGENSRHFWADGRGRDPHVIYQSFTAGAHYTKAGMTCTSCHAAHGSRHDADLLASDDNNQLCYICHGDMKPNLTGHTHHKPDSEGSNCSECHLPKIESFDLSVPLESELEIDRGIPTHSLSNPKPENSLLYGVPNACTICHEHKENSPEWAVKRLKEWQNDREVRRN